MKKALFILAVVSAALFSCAREDTVPHGGEEGVKKLVFNINVPYAKQIVSRTAWAATDDDTDGNKNLLVQNMYVLVFDENGFISRHKATQEAGVAQFSVGLPFSNGKPRVLHFICNYDKWDQFSDEDALYLNEATILSQMYVSGQTIAYWRRLELAGGIDATTTITDPIDMVRNVAMISVLNKSQYMAHQTEEVTSYIDNVSFAIGNYYDRGTLTWFNKDKTTGQFDGTGINEARGAQLGDIDEGADFVTGSLYNLNSTITEGQSLFAYERYNSSLNNANPLYLILKATFHINDADQPGTVCYYKVDIVHEGDDVLLDIKRNQHYTLNINYVLNNGYSSLPEAVAGLPLNNVNTTVMQSYNSISDGTALLNLDYVNRTFVTAGTSDAATKPDFSIRYSYIPDASTGATDNQDVLMTWGTESGKTPSIRRVNDLDNHKILLGYSGGFPVYPDGYGDPYVDEVSGKLAATLPAENVIAESWIKIRKNNLSRTIILKQRRPYVFGANNAITVSPATVAAQAGVSVTISFNIPEGLTDQLPFPIYIYASMLIPDIAYNNTYNDDSGNEFRHRYTVTHTGPHTLYFKTGSTVGGGDIIIKSDLFSDGRGYLTRQ